MADTSFAISLGILFLMSVLLLYICYNDLKLHRYLRKNYPELAKRRILTYPLLYFLLLKGDLKLDEYSKKLLIRISLMVIIALILVMFYFAFLTLAF